jgi:hypothetical protein
MNNIRDSAYFIGMAYVFVLKFEMYILPEGSVVLNKMVYLIKLNVLQIISP